MWVYVIIFCKGLLYMLCMCFYVFRFMYVRLSRPACHHPTQKSFPHPPPISLPFPLFMHFSECLRLCLLPTFHLCCLWLLIVFCVYSFTLYVIFSFRFLLFVPVLLILWSQIIVFKALFFIWMVLVYHFEKKVSETGLKVGYPGVFDLVGYL